MAERVELKAGDVVGPYRVIEAKGFAGILPIAVIREGNENAGVRVILTSPYRRSA